MIKALLISLAFLQCALSGMIGTTSCCGTCPETSIAYSPSMPNQFKSFIGLAISKNLPVTNITAYLKKLPGIFSKQLYNKLRGFDQQKRRNFAACPVNVTDTGTISFSQINLGTVEILFAGAKNIIALNSLGQSPNYVNTYTDFLQNQVLTKVRQINSSRSSIYVNSDRQNVEAEASSFGMHFISEIMNEFGPTQLDRYRDWQRSINSQCDHILGQSYYCTFINDLQMDLIEEAYPHQILSVDPTSFFETYLAKYSAESWWLFKTGSPITKHPSSVSSYNIFLQKYGPKDVSIYSPPFVNSIMSMNFSGNVNAPLGTDLNAGFGVGESSMTIWSRIMATVFGPYLYCRYPTLLSALQSSCAGTCKTC